MIIANPTIDELAKQSNNLLPIFANFENTFTYNEVSGGTNGLAENNTLIPYYGNRDLLITYTGTGAYRFNTGGNQLQFTIAQTGTYKFAFRVKSTNTDATILFGINLFKSVGGGSFTPVDTLQCTVNESSFGFVNNQFNTFVADINFDEGDVVDMDFSTETDDFSGTKLSVGGFKVELVDRNQYLPSIYTPVQPFELNITDTLDFPSITHGESETLQVNAIGALEGDFVECVAPTAVYLANLVVSAQVTESGKIDVTLTNVSGSLIDPASGDYKLYLIRR